MGAHLELGGIVGFRDLRFDEVRHKSGPDSPKPVLVLDGRGRPRRDRAGGWPRGPVEVATPTRSREDVGASNNPNLNSLANNGGPTQTMLPQSGSPLIEGVTAGSCQAGGAAGVTTDQRGLPRPDTSSPACDIGAVEVQRPSPPTAVIVTPRLTG